MADTTTPNKKKSRTSYAMAVIPGTLNTDYAQKAYNRHFRKVGGSLYQISVLGRKMGANIIDATAIEDLEKQIDAAFDGRIADMQKAIDEMKAKAGDKIDRIRFQYMSPMEVEYMSSTGLQMKYIDVIEKLDELVMCIDSMALLRLKTTADQVRESYEARRAIEGTSSNIIGVATKFSTSLNQLIADTKSNGKKKARPLGELFEDKAPEPKGMDTTPIAVSA